MTGDTGVTWILCVHPSRESKSKDAKKPRRRFNARALPSKRLTDWELRQSVD